MGCFCFTVRCSAEGSQLFCTHQECLDQVYNRNKDCGKIASNTNAVAVVRRGLLSLFYNGWRKIILVGSRDFGRNFVLKKIKVDVIFYIFREFNILLDLADS